MTFLVTSIVIALSPALAVPPLLALHIGQMPEAGRLGEVGFAVNLLGLGRLVSAGVFVVGVVLFGVAMLRGGV
jgi:hypothetical protein